METVTKQQAIDLAKAYLHVGGVRISEELTIGEWWDLRYNFDVLKKIQHQTGIELVSDERMAKIVAALEPESA